MSIVAGGRLTIRIAIIFASRGGEISDRLAWRLVVHGFDHAVGRKIQLVQGGCVALPPLLIQMAKSSGARLVVAAAGSREKLSLTRDLGADVMTDYTESGWAVRVREATGGHGVA